MAGQEAVAPRMVRRADADWQFRLLVDDAPHPVLVYSTAHGIIRYANRELAALIGRDPDHLVGCAVKDVLIEVDPGGEVDDGHPTEREPGQPLDGEYGVRDADGKVHYLEAR